MGMELFGRVDRNVKRALEKKLKELRANKRESQNLKKKNTGWCKKEGL